MAMPISLNNPACASFNDRLYVIGAGKVLAYDATANSWSEHGDFDLDHTGLCASVLNQRIFIFGARTAGSYDPMAGTTTRFANRPVFTGGQCAEVSGVFYQAGITLEAFY